MKELSLNYEGTFIKELRIVGYVIAGLGILGIIAQLISGDLSEILPWLIIGSTLVSCGFFAGVALVLAFIGESALVQKAKAEVELYEKGYQLEKDSFFLSNEAMTELKSKGENK